MKPQLSSHGTDQNEFHIVWIPKYRNRILKGELKKFIEIRLWDIQEYHPDIEIVQYSFQEDIIHLVIVIPPK
jgi:putative transposase